MLRVLRRCCSRLCTQTALTPVTLSRLPPLCSRARACAALSPPRAASTVKGKASIKAGFLEDETDVAAYSHTADDDYDFM